MSTKEKIRFIIGRIFKFAIAGAGCYLVYRILHELTLLDVFRVDIIPWINIKHIIVLLGMLILIFTFAPFKESFKTGVSIAIKKYYPSILSSMFLSGVIFWEKYYEKPSFLIMITFEYVWIFILLENEATRVHKYKFTENRSNVSNFTEMPIVGFQELTTPQKNAYNQLVKVLDKRTREENINIALMAQWGKGKTSVTDTIIYELQKRGDSEPRYFFLKINSQTFNGTGNIIEYVKDFFYELFKRYGILMFEGKSSLAFLTNLSDMLKEEVVISSFFNGNWNSEFSDLENERQFFCDRVQLLLKRSGYKNIVFIIDDVDRSESYDKIWQLLGEFSSIRGLITIISLNDNVGSSNISNLEEGKEETDEEPIYKYIDKYIHVRIRIEDIQKIEYEKNIKKQIIEEKNNIAPLKNSYINLNTSGEQISLFSTVKSYQTIQRIGINAFNQPAKSMLNTIFLEKLELDERSFGKFFEDMIMEYMYRSKELSPLIQKMLDVIPDKWDMTLHQVRFNWTDAFNDDFFSWTMRLRSNSFQYFNFISGLLEGLILIEKKDDVKNEIGELFDIYDFYNRTKFQYPESNWENRKENPIIYSGIDEFILLAFNDKERINIQELLKVNEYEKIKQILLEKVRQIGNFLVQVALLADFIDYMRKNMNNYRRFKMQLREAEIQELNCLDYLLKEWQPKSQTRKNIDNMKSQFPTLEKIQFEWPSLGACIDRMIFMGFICNYNPTIYDDLKDAKLWMYYGKARKLLVVSYKSDHIRCNIIMNIEGGLAQTTNEEEKEIKEIAEKILD